LSAPRARIWTIEAAGRSARSTSIEPQPIIRSTKATWTRIKLATSHWDVEKRTAASAESLQPVLVQAKTKAGPHG
jgi:hypothetical protein